MRQCSGEGAGQCRPVVDDVRSYFPCVVVKGVKNTVEAVQCAAAAAAATSLHHSSPLSVMVGPTAAADPLDDRKICLLLPSCAGAGEGAGQTFHSRGLLVPISLTRVTFSLFVPRLCPRLEVTLVLTLPRQRRCSAAIVTRHLTR